MNQTIKKHKNNNQYILTPSGYWVRDFTQPYAPYDINDFFNRSELKFLASNETKNLSLKIPSLDSDYMPNIKKAVIVSDGYGFDKKKECLANLPNDVVVICVNRSLAKWNLKNNHSPQRIVNYYFVNNPYDDCMRFMPTHAYRPKCICSLRTHHEFLKKYKGEKSFYIPTPDSKYGKKYIGQKFLDDYRNPICGAINFLAKCNIRKLLLFCCDDAFDKERPAAEKMNNGLWMYPQHKVSYEIIDGMIYWLKSQEDTLVEVANHSNSIDYKNAPYIETERMKEFFI